MLFDTTQLALQRSIEGADARQNALAANLANAETPGYQRVDVDFHSQLAAAMNQGASAPAALQDLSFTPQVDASAGATQADGSTVDVDSESAKLAANGLDQQTAVQVAQVRDSILQIAMGTK